MIALVANFTTTSASGQERYREELIGGEATAHYKILLIPVEGVIISGENTGFWGMQEDPVESVLSALKKAESDGLIKAIILDVDSPGGGITACDRIHTALKRFRKKRPDVILVSCMESVAASGGYYISTATNRIIAHPTTITGSIGVIAHLLNIQGLYEKIGLRDEIIKSGDKKDMGSATRAMTDEEREIMQNLIDEMYQRFIDVIVEGRPDLERQEILALADGRIYTGQQALQNGLVDELGDRQDAFESAKKLAGTNQAKLIKYRRHMGIFELFQATATRSAEGFNSQIKKLLLEKNTPRLMYLWTIE